MSWGAQQFAGPRAFARHMLAGDRLQLRPLFDSAHAFAGIATESVVFREGCWQVELVAMLPGAVVPRHRHNRVDSVDLVLGGTGRGDVAGRPLGAPQRGRLAANLVRVPKGRWHGGQAGEQGVLYLSFQQWDGPPGLISEDWEAWPPEQK
jgi:quercetin dioxygenase-like cupin family protein